VNQEVKEQWVKALRSGDYLQGEVMDWAELTDSAPQTPRGGLIELNDGLSRAGEETRAHSFNEIADVIEEYL
jgi:hypothetical protein